MRPTSRRRARKGSKKTSAERTFGRALRQVPRAQPAFGAASARHDISARSTRGSSDRRNNVERHQEAANSDPTGRPAGPLADVSDIAGRAGHRDLSAAVVDLDLRSEAAADRDRE